VRSNCTNAGDLFPGGKIDPTDASPTAAVLRETWEELGIHPEQVEIIASMDAWQERSLSGLAVLPYVGFVSPSPNKPPLPSSPLPSLNLASLTLSRTEVAQVFHLPFDELLTPSRLRSHLFRDLQPYWAVDVSDKVNASVHTTGEIADEVGGGRNGHLEVWGLTGWYLSRLMHALDVW